MNKLLLAHLALFSTNLIYGINYTVAKDVMPNYIKPFGFIFCRVTGALALFWLFHSLFYREKILKKDFPRLLLCGLFGVAINQLLFFEGLNNTTPINAAIIMTSNPVLVLVMASMMLKERISKRKVGGIALGLSGAILLIIFKGDFQFGSNTIYGDFLIFINASSYAAYLVLVKPLMMKYKPLTVIKWVFLFGYLVVIPFGWNQFTEIQWVEMPTKIIYETLFVIIGTTFLAYLFNVFALRQVSPSTASTYIYLQPVLAGAFAIWMGVDQLDFIKVFSAAIIITGVYLVSNAQKVTR